MTTIKSTITFKNVSKHSFYNKKIHILSNIRIKKKIDMPSYINTNIHTHTLNNKEFIIAFDDEEFLNKLKEKCKHPYYISSPVVSDILFYINQSKNNIVIYNNIKNVYTYFDVNNLKSKSMISLSESDNLNELISLN